MCMDRWRSKGLERDGKGLKEKRSDWKSKWKRCRLIFPLRSPLQSSGLSWLVVQPSRGCRVGIWVSQKSVCPLRVCVYAVTHSLWPELLAHRRFLDMHTHTHVWVGNLSELGCSCRWWHYPLLQAPCSQTLSLTVAYFPLWGNFFTFIP